MYCAIITIEVIFVRNIILVRNLTDSESAKRIEQALAETRADYRIDLDKRCVIIEGNSDMVAVARKVITDLGFVLL